MMLQLVMTKKIVIEMRRELMQQCLHWRKACQMGHYLLLLTLAVRLSAEQTFQQQKERANMTRGT